MPCHRLMTSTNFCYFMQFGHFHTLVFLRIQTHLKKARELQISHLNDCSYDLHLLLMCARVFFLLQCSSDGGATFAYCDRGKRENLFGAIIEHLQKANEKFGITIFIGIVLEKCALEMCLCMCGKCKDSTSKRMEKRIDRAYFHVTAITSVTYNSKYLRPLFVYAYIHH